MTSCNTEYFQATAYLVGPDGTVTHLEDQVSIEAALAVVGIHDASVQPTSDQDDYEFGVFMLGLPAPVGWCDDDRTWVHTIPGGDVTVVEIA